MPGRITPYELPARLVPAGAAAGVDPGRAALLINDMQERFLTPYGPMQRTIVGNVAMLLECARRTGMLIVFAAQNPTQDAGRNQGQDAARNPAQDAARNPAQDAARNPAQDAARNPAGRAAVRGVAARAAVPVAVHDAVRGGERDAEPGGGLSAGQGGGSGGAGGGVEPGPGEVLLVKRRYSAFAETPLAELLQGRDQLIVTGLYAHLGVLATALDALERDVVPFVVADAVADFSPAHHAVALRHVAGRGGSVVTTAQVVAELAAGS